MKGSKSSKTKTVDWSEFIGHKDILSAVPEGYSCASEIATDVGMCQSAIQARLREGFAAGKLDRISVKLPGKRQVFYYKQT